MLFQNGRLCRVRPRGKRGICQPFVMVRVTGRKHLHRYFRFTYYLCFFPHSRFIFRAKIASESFFTPLFESRLTSFFGHAILNLSTIFWEENEPNKKLSQTEINGLWELSFYKQSEWLMPSLLQWEKVAAEG